MECMYVIPTAWEKKVLSMKRVVLVFFVWFCFVVGLSGTVEGAVRGEGEVWHDVGAEVKDTLSRMQEELDSISPGQFIQPYRGYIVNLDAVRTVASDRIFLNNGEFILIKRGDFRRIRSLLFAWSFGNGRH